MFARLSEASVPLPFLSSSDPPLRVPGTAVFLTATPDATPHALLHNLNHNKVLHERVVFLTVEIRDVPGCRSRIASPASASATAAGGWACATAS